MQRTLKLRNNLYKKKKFKKSVCKAFFCMQIIFKFIYDNLFNRINKFFSLYNLIKKALNSLKSKCFYSGFFFVMHRGWKIYTNC